MRVSQESVLAGTLIPYSITVEDLDGNVIEDNLTVDITSDIESDLYWTATNIMPVKVELFSGPSDLFTNRR